MQIKKTKIKNLYLIKIKGFKDDRGFFFRNYCKKKLSPIFKKNFVQSNISINKKKFTLRGFHYQKEPTREHKLITCISGKIFNVVIDLRKNSKTYGNVVKFRMSPNNNQSLLIPAGCANAFMTLKKNTVIHYLMSDYYKPYKNRSFNYLSDSFKIKWPNKPSSISLDDLNSKFLKF